MKYPRFLKAFKVSPVTVTYCCADCEAAPRVRPFQLTDRPKPFRKGNARMG